MDLREQLRNNVEQYEAGLTERYDKELRSITTRMVAASNLGNYDLIIMDFNAEYPTLARLFEKFQNFLHINHIDCSRIPSFDTSKVILNWK